MATLHRRAVLAIVASAGCGGAAVPASTPPVGELRERIAAPSQEGLAFTVELVTSDRPPAVEVALRFVTRVVVGTHSYLELGDTERVAREIGRGATEWLCGRTVTVRVVAIEPVDLPADVADKVRAEMARARSRPAPLDVPSDTFAAGCPGRTPPRT